MNFLFGHRMFDPRPQGRDPECQVVGKFCQEFDLLGVECIRLGRIDGEGTEDSRIDKHGDGDTRRITALQGLGTPGTHPWIRRDVLRLHRLTHADACASRPAPTLGVCPRDV
jgi:hypothetical protein